MTASSNPGWKASSARTEDDLTTLIHVHPVDDLIDHELTTECVCGTDQELLTDEDFTKMCVIVSHNSLDNRESKEEDCE